MSTSTGLHSGLHDVVLLRLWRPALESHGGHGIPRLFNQHPASSPIGGWPSAQRGLATLQRGAWQEVRAPCDPWWPCAAPSLACRSDIVAVTVEGLLCLFLGRICLTVIERSLALVRDLPCLPPAGAAQALGQRQRQAGWPAGHSSATQAGAAIGRAEAGEVPGHHKCMHTFSNHTRTAILAKHQICLVSACKLVTPVMSD